MKLSAMRYKEFIWPNNPRTVQLRYAKEMKRFLLPFVGSTAQNLGDSARVVECEGEFYGSTAFASFTKLSGVFKQKQTGQLILPGMEPFFAHFISLEMAGKPGPGVIDYQCVFLEEPAHQLQQSRSLPVCTAGENDTLWDISSEYNISLEKLLMLNPDIRDPFTLLRARKIQLA